MIPKSFFGIFKIHVCTLKLFIIWNFFPASGGYFGVFRSSIYREFFLVFRRQQIWIHLKHRWIYHARVQPILSFVIDPLNPPPWSMTIIYAPQIIPKTICGSLILHPKKWVDLDSSRQFVATNAQTENSRHFPPSALDSESPAGVPGV